MEDNANIYREVKEESPCEMEAVSCYGDDVYFF